MRERLTIPLSLVALLAMPPATAVTTSQSLPPFRLVVARTVRQLQAAVQEASAHYAVALGSPANGLVVLRRLDPSEQRSFYRVLEGRAAIDQALARGFRGVRGTLDTIDGRVALIARDATGGELTESLLLGSPEVNPFENQTREARTKGFRVVDMANDAEGYWALVERPDATLDEGGDPGVLLVSADLGYLDRRLYRRGAAGYRITGTAAWRFALVSLERSRPRPTRRFEYRVLSAADARTLELEMNMAAHQDGFRYTPDTLRTLERYSLGWFGRLGSEVIVIMETDHYRGPARKYLVLAERRASTLTRAFDEALAKGFVPVGLTHAIPEGETLIVLERRP